MGPGRSPSPQAGSAANTAPTHARPIFIPSWTASSPSQQSPAARRWALYPTARRPPRRTRQSVLEPHARSTRLPPPPPQKISPRPLVRARASERPPFTPPPPFVHHIARAHWERPNHRCRRIFSPFYGESYHCTVFLPMKPPLTVPFFVQCCRMSPGHERPSERCCH
jgi:hypothetical protein